MQIIVFLMMCISLSFAQVLKTTEFPTPSNLVPAYILSSFDKLVLIAEKNSGKLHLFKGEKYLHSYPMSTGLKKGSKRHEGDFRTPLGVYIIEKHLDQGFLNKAYKEMASLYGAGALTLNYPNPIDRKNNKNGTNIWLHGTSNPERLKELQSSRGCVVIHNESFSEILELFKLEKMFLVIVDDLEWITKDAKEAYTQGFNGLRFRNQWLDLTKNKYSEGP